MDRYQRVEKPKEEAPINENEIRITAQGRMRNYISYATGLLHEKNLDVIVFKAMGRAINKTVMIVELMKRRIVGLHQITNIASTDITDTWEPLEEGLLPLETTRQVSMITITLSKTDLDPSTVGYQPPLPSDQVKQWSEIEYEGDDSPSGRGRGRGGFRGRGGGRGRGRNNRGNINPVNDYSNGGGWENGGRGGRSGRSRGNFRGGRVMRGGYGGRGDYQYEAGGYNEAPNFQGGRGAMGGDYGGQGDYQQYEAGGRGDYQQYEAGGHGGRGDYQQYEAGGRGGRGDYQQYEAGGRGGYHDDGSFRGGRGRGRGRAQNRGRGRGYRSNGPPPAAAAAEV
ncbi:hypothetical protein ZOSMA_64G00170 [Zostera marina]|uniref:DNA/RNA-binding protein Alba-like domain-containing protein n=1 Tax=Zostera marina TaxID=29655 RepID=A0A0K9NUS0_ZOSMR|nr:hypothetical protein ZOSMA_64G00170 [Zostera marina]